MAEVVLFHHVLGLTDGVRSFADSLREAGHTVHTPDFFEGKTFASIDDGLAYVDEAGFDAIIERALQASAALPTQVVYGGFSLGAVVAQRLLQTNPQASGALLLHGFADPAWFEGQWPGDIPAQLHGMDRDPFLIDDGDLEAARATQTEHGNLEIFLYPGSGHLFTDKTSTDYDETATGLVLNRAIAMLDGLALSP